MKKRLNLEELSLELPKIETNEARFLLGGDDYADSPNNCNCPQGAESVDTSSSTSENNNIDPPLPDTTNYDSQDYDPVENEQDQDENEENNNENQQDDPHYIKPLNQLPQIDYHPDANTCMPDAMEYIREFFTGIDDNTGDPATDDVFFNEVSNFYHSISFHDIQSDGVAEPYFQSIVEHFFHNNPIDLTQAQAQNNIFQALDNGTPLLAAVTMSDGSNHFITIIGYNPENNQLIFADTATGQIHSTENVGFTLDYAWVITGVKP